MWRFRNGKFNARKTKVGTQTFASRAEAAMYEQLVILERCGKIKDLKTQVEFTLQPAYTVGRAKIRPIKYRADFTFFDIPQNRYRILDCKGMRTPVYALKKKIFEYINRDAGLLIEESI